MYRFKPEGSNYNIFRILGFLDYLPNFLGSGLKLIVSKLASISIANIKGLIDLDTRNIPYRLINLFDKTSNKEMIDSNPFTTPTIFDILKENNLRYEYIDSSKVNPFLAIDRLKKDTALTIIYIHYLDYAAHRYGLNNEKFKNCLNTVDNISNILVRKAKAKIGPELNIVIFSDHGMTMPKKYINLSNIVKNSKHGKDYLLFLDSTIIHIWYINSNKKNETKKMINELGIGHILSDEEKKKLRIYFNNRMYGDDIYLLEPNYQIFPNYISILRPKGMHAYHPKYEHQHGILILKNETIKKEYIELPDITATLYKLLDLKSPNSCEGRSVV